MAAISSMHNDRLPKKILFGQVKGNVCKGALGVVSTMLCCMIVSHAALVDLTRMLRIDPSGKTRLALHAPEPFMSWHGKQYYTISVVIFLL